MNDSTNISEQATTSAAETGNTMQHIQDMIGDLLKNAVEKMHKTDIGEKLGDTPSDVGEKSDLSADLDISDIKNFIGVMQKFIDNVRVMVLHLETGSSEIGGTEDNFLESYMETADNVLEIAAFSMKDSVTGLSNKYGFENRLILEWNRATRDKTDLSLVIFGLNGLEAGKDSKMRDDALKAVSEILESSIKRTTDFIARWSDDEFAALLPITGTGGATIVAERILAEIGKMDIAGSAENSKKPSVSIGVCVHTPEPNEQPIGFINKAHDAYDKAKESSGSMIVFA